MGSPTLIQRTGRAAFWNAVLFPLKALLGLTFTVVLARRFELDLGIYNTAMGVVTSVVMFSSLGIPTSLTKFLPELEASAGPAAVVVFLRRVASYRLLLAAVALVPLNLFAAPLAQGLDLGSEGVFILRLASVLIASRALFDLCIRSLNAFFGQLRSNLLDILQGSLDVALAFAAISLGFTIGGVFGVVIAGSVVAALVAVRTTRGALRQIEPTEGGAAFAPIDPVATRAAVDAEHSRFVGFALFTYVFELSIYFSDKSFASPALAIVLGRDEVAIFSTGFTLAFMSVGLMVASFRGVYRPMFAHLRTRDDVQQLRSAFSGVSKVQLLVLFPAGVGLFIMVADYIPLLFGEVFTPAVPVAQTFVVLMYTQTAFNLGMIWLSIDERYRVVLYIQSILIVAVPFFLIVASTRGLVAAALVFGGARLIVSVTGYLVCHRDYGFRFPWRFAAKTGAVAGCMGVVLVILRRYLPQSGVEAAGLTLVGALIYLAGLRVARILGPDEIDLLERSNVPGKRLAIAWLAPGR